MLNLNTNRAVLTTRLLFLLGVVACTEPLSPPAPTLSAIPRYALAGQSTPVPMLAGDEQLTTCGLSSSGVISCWGYGLNDRTNAPTSGGPFVQISMGSDHGCAVDASGGIVCWGQNPFGDGFSPFPPSDISGVKQVSVGGVRTCALIGDGTVQCWGVFGSAPPTGLTSVVQIDAGQYDTCALKSDGTVVCWGTDYSGQIYPPAGLNSVAHVSAGTYHTCALKTDGTVVCWGSNENGQLNIPADLSAVIQVSAGQFHTCALKADRTVVCWGGIDAFGMSNVPSGLSGVRQVMAGGLNSCVLKSDGSVLCWGYDGYGTVPADLSLGAEVTAVPTVTAVSSAPLDQQYSDKVNLSASVSATSAAGSAISGTVQFKIDGVNVGEPQLLSEGTATLANYQLTQTAEAHALSAEFTSTSAEYSSSASGDASFNVLSESMVVTAVAGNATKLTAGPSGTASTTLAFEVRELVPDLAGLAAAPGNGNFLYLTVSVTKQGGSSISLSCTNFVSGTGYSASNSLWCPTGNLPVGVYQISANGIGIYYAGSYTGTLNIKKEKAK